MPSNALRLGDLANQVWSLTKDKGTQVTRDDIEAWVNEAQMDLATRLGLDQVEKPGTITGGTVPLPAVAGTDREVVRIHSLRLGGDDDVEFVDDDVFHTWADSGDNPGHTLGRVFAGVVELYPTPADGTAYELRHDAIPMPLHADDDVSSLPHHLHVKLLFWARWMGLSKVGQDERAVAFYQLYEAGLPERELGQGKLTPGPLSLSIEPGPFDGPDAWHV